MERNEMIQGKLSCSAKGFFGFVIPDEGEDIFVPGEKLGDALNGDTVLAREEQPADGSRHREGYIVKVLERGNKTVVGVIYKKKEGTLRLRPDSRQFYNKIKIRPENSMDVQIGMRAAAEITEYAPDGSIYGRVVSVLGAENSLKSCVEGILIENKIKTDFDVETLTAAYKVPETIRPRDLTGRTDLRNRIIFTIDGDDARDFDDAVSLDILENGNYLLGVHIADVTHYVKSGSQLDNEAFERGTSVYLADRVIPMLPERLSNGICSLNPNADRLTLSVFIEVSQSGETVGHNLEESVIRSCERMTYNNVNAMLERGDKSLCERYDHILPTLLEMEKLSALLRKKRVKRGSLDFDFPEAEIIVDKNGEPIEIVKEERGVSNRMIEEFMLLANETIAEYAYWSELPFVYRTHEPPSIDKIAAFGDFIKSFGLTLKGKIDEDNPVHSKELQKILDTVKGKPEERLVASTMLRSMMKAEYKPVNLGHFGLAAKYYCHFTSPIRRYPDLSIHRILKEFINGRLKSGQFEAFATRAAQNSTDMEISAEHTERDVDDLMKTAYMAKFLGESFDAVIANVTGFGMFVELENTVQGLIRLENMTDDYYEFDERSNSLHGRLSGKSYKIGGAVRVTLIKADILLRQIDFVLEEHFEPKMIKKPKKSVKKLAAHRKVKHRKRKKSKGNKENNGTV